jgi:trans-2,3-dihydro-3-hydroxyanthranilate isomerase
VSDHRFATLDVFTDTPFCGNPLAVVWDCDDVDDATMLSVAQEFGFSETVFLQSTTTAGCDIRTRIYTPTGELPFAGHPTIGSAVALEAEFGNRMTFDQLAGPAAVKVAGGRAVFTIERTVELGPADEVDREAIAAAIGLDPDDLVTGGRVMSAGNPFLAVQLATLEALGRVQVGDVPTTHALYLYVSVTTGHAAIRARLLAPHQGIAEDPATGSAAAALAGVLAETSPDGPVGFTIEQGIEMGRPSRIDVTADVMSGQAVRVRVGGAAVIVTEGSLHLA